MRGRIRTIKPEIGKNEDLWDLYEETGLPVYQAFTLLWCYADREGRFEWRPRALKTDVLPYWNGDFSRVLDALVTRGFIVRYTVDGRDYGLIPSFRRHQAVNNRESPSELPEPPENPPEKTVKQPDSDASSTRESRVSDAHVHAPVEGKGREGNGNGNGNVALTTRVAQAEPGPTKPRKRRPSGARFVPDDWQPKQTHAELATQLGVTLEAERVKFTSHEFRTARTDWDRAFTGWLQRASQYAESRSGPAPQSGERHRGLALLYGKVAG